MTDIKISTEDKKEERPVEEDIKKILKDADDYAKEKQKQDEEVQRIIDDNKKMKEALEERENLRARLVLGGKALAGQYVPEKSEKEIADEEAKAILSMIR